MCSDRGEASPLFSLGANVKGGIYGHYPSLSDLDGGDLKFTAGFRSVYSTFVERRFGRPSPGVPGGSFQALALLSRRAAFFEEYVRTNRRAPR